MLRRSLESTQYSSNRYREALAARGIECSMSRRANCWDNAVAESFFGSFKNEWIYRRPWLTGQDAKDAIGEYIEIFYNRIRRHSTIGYVSPRSVRRNGSGHEGPRRITKRGPFFWNKVTYLMRPTTERAPGRGQLGPAGA